MKVDGQSSFWFDFFGQQDFKEATVKKESAFDWASFGTKKNLSIDAGAGDDVIEVKKTGEDEYTVTVNGQKFQLTKEEMKNLKLDGGAGNDTIIIDKSVDVAINVSGGDGDDAIVNYANGATIDGGAGNDRIASLADGCTVSGGKGDDEVYVHGNANKVSGTGAKSFWDLLFAQQEKDHVTVEGFANKVD